MAFIQKTSPPRNERLEFNLSSFSGGLNNRSSVIEDNQASNILNMHFTHQDVLEKRYGFEPIDDIVIDEPITHVSVYKPYNSDDQIIRATNTKVYVGNTKIADVQGEIDSVNYQGLLFFCDGEDLFAYGTFPNVTGTYLQVIGTTPEVDVTLKVVNPPGDFVPLDKVHQQGKIVVNYDAGTIHYEPCEQELDDPYLGANLMPEHPKFIEVHKSRLFVSGDRKDNDNVYITDISTPYYFAVGLPIQLPPNSDKVRGMTVFDDAILIGREYDMYYISGDTNNPMLGFPLHSLRRVNTHTGIANHKSTDVAHNYLFFMGSDGFAYALATVHLDEKTVATQIISNNIDVFKEPIGITREELLDASSIFDGEYWYVTLGDLTLVYSYRNRAWTVFDYVDIYAPTKHEGELIWGRKDGKVVKFTEDYLDDGRPIYALWESKTFDFGSAVRYKQFREFFLVAHAWDFNDSDIRVTFEIDYSDVHNATIVDNKIAYWNKAKWGDRFITRNINASIPFVVGRRARYMKIRIANSHPVHNFVEREQDLYDIPKKYNYMGALVTSTNTFYYYENGNWTAITEQELKQPMRVYKINGDYEMKGKR